MKRLVMWVAVLLILSIPTVAMAQDNSPAAKAAMTSGDRVEVIRWVAISISVITALSIVGAGYAVAHVGSAAIGATSEKPEMMARSLVFVALGEGLAVLGLAVAFVLLFQVLKPVLDPLVK